VPGVLVNDQTRASLTVKEAQTLIADGIIKGGMVAKMESAFEALDQDVPRVHIIQWQGPPTLRSIIQGKFKSGTTIIVLSKANSNPEQRLSPDNSQQTTLSQPEQNDISLYQPFITPILQHSRYY